MHWLKLLKNNLNQQLFKSKHLQESYFQVVVDIPVFWQHLTYGFSIYSSADSPA
jgi:hypothetical protein